MPLPSNLVTGIIAGQTGTFDAVAVPAGSVVTGVPVWASDNVLAVVTAAADGLSASVAVDGTATGSFTLTVTSTNADESTATGSAVVPILAAPPVPVASFDIRQTS